MRRALMPVTYAASTFAAWTDEDLLGLLAAVTAALALGAIVVFSLCERIARQRGLIDRASNY